MIQVVSEELKNLQLLFLPLNKSLSTLYTVYNLS